MAPDPFLIRIPTTDGLLLDGALFESPAGKPRMRAWVFLHGTGSNFTAPGILEGLAQLFVTRGEAVLRVNTRGHDLHAKIPTMSGSVPGGAAFENVGDAHLDVSAACAALLEAGYDKLSLLGHSLGGVKAIAAQAEHPVAEVDEIVALSPPRLCHERLKTDPSFYDDFCRARLIWGMREDADRLIHLMSPVSIWMTPKRILDKYGPDDRYDIVKHLPHVKPATLIFLDTKSLESSAAHKGLDESLSELARSHSALAVQRHPDDIRYAGSEVAIANHIAAWRSKRDAVMDAGI